MYVPLQRDIEPKIYYQQVKYLNGHIGFGQKTEQWLKLHTNKRYVSRISAYRALKFVYIQN